MEIILNYIQLYYLTGNIGMIKILIQNGAIADVGMTNWLREGIKVFEDLQKFMGYNSSN